MPAIRGVRMGGSGSKDRVFREGAAAAKRAVDGIRLVTVGHDVTGVGDSDGTIDNQSGILQRGFVEGPGSDNIVFGDKHPVSASRASAHDPVDLDEVSGIRSLADDDPASRIYGISERVQVGFNGSAQFAALLIFLPGTNYAARVS